MELAFTEVDLGDIIRGVMSTAVGLVKEKSIELILDIPDDLPPLQADNIRIRQVLLNLVSNAAKFTEEGHIGVSARTIKRGHQTDIVIAVFDTGPGIHLSDQEKIFEPFSQVDASPTRKTGGTGLGLSICRHLVELHGGVIWVESVPGEGSTFAFTLPYTPPEHPQVTKQPLILGIHTDIDVLKVYREVLERNSFRFHNLTRPDHTVEVAQALKPDLLLFDMSKASQEDWSLLALTRSEPSLESTQILVTALDAQNDRGTFLGVRDVLATPLRDQAVNQVLESAFKKSVQNAKLMVFVDEPQNASVRAFFENLGGMQIQVLSDHEQALQALEDHDFEGFILALTLPWNTYDSLLETIMEGSGNQTLPPVIGLLPEADHPHELEQVMELAEHRWTHATYPKDDYTDRLIAFLQTLAP